MEADQATTTSLVRADLLAADGSTPGQGTERRRSTPASSIRPSASPRRAACCRRAKAAACRWCRSTCTEVDVEFLRVSEKNLPQVLRRVPARRPPRQLGPGQRYYDDDKHAACGELAEPVYVNRFVLGGKPNERVLTYLPIQDITELQEPGLYFAVMKRTGKFTGEFETAFFTVSDIGLHTRAYKDKLFVHAASLQQRRRRRRRRTEGARRRRARPFLKGETDGNGNALLDYKLDAGHVLVATRGKDVSMLPFNQPALDLSEFAVAGREQAWFDVFAWSGRDLYRPGETVRISALLRDNDGKPIDAKGKAAQPIFLRLQAARRQDLPRNAPAAGRAGLLQLRAGDSGRCADRALAGRIPHRSGQQGSGAGHDPAHRGIPARAHEARPRHRAGGAASRASRSSCKATAAYLYGAPAAGNRFTAQARGRGRTASARSSCRAISSATRRSSLPKEAKDVIDAKLRRRRHARARHRAAGGSQADQRRSRRSCPAACTKPAAAASTARSSACCGRPKRWSACARCSTTRTAPTPTAMRGFELVRVDRRRQAAAGQGPEGHAGARTPRLPLELRRRRRLGLRLHPAASRIWNASTRRRRRDARRKIDFPVEWGDYRSRCSTRRPA